MDNGIDTTKVVIPMTNTPVSEQHNKFVTNAERRVNAALKALDVLQQCFNADTYDYTSEEVEKVLGALESKIVDIRSAAEHGSSYSHFSFN